MSISERTQSDLLRSDEAAKIIDRSESWLNQQRCKGRGPRYIRIGNSIRYRRTDLDSYLSSSTVETEDTRRHAARQGRAA